MVVSHSISVYQNNNALTVVFIEKRGKSPLCRGFYFLQS
jgi:hypothetical protein